MGSLLYPSTLESSNNTETGFPIAKGNQISGGRNVATLNDLYLMYDYILSPSGNNTDNDALGTTVYVQSEEKHYMLIDWTNRRNAEGWEVAGGDEQVQADWNEDDSSEKSYIENKPAIKTSLGNYSIAEGDSTIAKGDYSHAEGCGGTLIESQLTKLSDYDFLVGGDFSKYEKSIFYYNDVLYTISYASFENNSTRITLDQPITDDVEYITVSILYGAANGYTAHSEGNYTIASGTASHAEGDGTIALGDQSHAEGYRTIASGSNSHAEGDSTIACGEQSHAEGRETKAEGIYSHAEGFGTVATNESEHVFGEFNIIEEKDEEGGRGQYVEIVGNGSWHALIPERSNARTLDWHGNEWLQGTATAQDFILDGSDPESSLSGVASSVSTLEESVSNIETTLENLATVATSGDYNDLENTPSYLSDFTNDEGFIDNTVSNLEHYYDKDEVNNLISSASHLKILVVEELPQDPDTDTIYLVPVEGSPTGDNVYEEYIYILTGSPAEGHWEMIGTAQVDLSDYMQKSNNLNDVADRQTALNNLTFASSQDAGKVLTIDSNGDASFAAIPVISDAFINALS